MTVMMQRDTDVDTSVSSDEKMINLMHQIFHLEQNGKELLELLQQNYIQNPTAVSFDNPNEMYFREGENSIVRLFRAAKGMKQEITQKRNEEAERTKASSKS